MACLFQSGNDLSLLAMGVGRNQLHLPDVAADWFALCLDAATVQLNSQASQTHPFTDGHEGQEHHDRGDEDSAAHHCAFYKFCNT